MSGRAVIFGDSAADYDRYRPSYPEAAISHVKRLANGDRWLEIGAGTGKATVDMIGRNREITCLEPSVGMADVLRGRGLEGVEVVDSDFEGWSGPVGQFDLIYAAQSWHWVDHETGYEKAKRLLSPDGAIALMWNVLLDRYETFRDLYERHAPQIAAEADERIKKRDGQSWTEDLAAAGFVHVERFTHTWQSTLRAVDYVGLCASYSDHMMLPDPQRRQLLAAISDAIGDGEVVLDYRTEVYAGRAPGG